MSYTIAVDLKCLEPDAANPEEKLARCLLADWTAVRRGASGMIFYPFAFNPGYGNFASTGPPRFLRYHVFAVVKDNVSFQSDRADVLTCNYFQAYSNIKHTLRNNLTDLLATQGTATAALTLPISEAQVLLRVKSTQQKPLRQLQGSNTPEDPDASRPFAREHKRIQQIISEDEFTYRMEQVTCLDVARLLPSRRNLRMILRPLVQLMRFYLQETQHYTKILRSFQPTVFPKILGSFARVFHLRISEILKRFMAQKSQAFGIALSEGVAAMDRLGDYCFTRRSIVLLSTVFRPLKTMESLQKGGWPYINPEMLDLRIGEGSLDFIQWLRTKDGRPIFMHLASLGFQYGPEAAASRHSLLWFRDLGGKSIIGPVSGTRFLEELFRDLWIPQIVAYVAYQLRRQLGLSRRYDDDVLSEELEVRQTQRGLVDRWEKSVHPFTWRSVLSSSSRLAGLQYQEYTAS